MNIFLSSKFFILKVLFWQFFTIETFEFKSIKFINNISLTKSPITFTFFERMCAKQHCYGTVKIKIDNEWFIVNLNEKHDQRKLIQYICNDFGNDILYYFAFQCISASKLLSSAS